MGRRPIVQGGPTCLEFGKRSFTRTQGQCGWPRAAFLRLENQVRVTATYRNSGMSSSENRWRGEDLLSTLADGAATAPSRTAGVGQASRSEGLPFSPHPPKPPGTPPILQEPPPPGATSRLESPVRTFLEACDRILWASGPVNLNSHSLGV